MKKSIEKNMILNVAALVRKPGMLKFSCMKLPLILVWSGIPKQSIDKTHPLEETPLPQKVSNILNTSSFHKSLVMFWTNLSLLKHLKAHKTLIRFLQTLYR